VGVAEAMQRCCAIATACGLSALGLVRAGGDEAVQQIVADGTERLRELTSEDRAAFLAQLLSSVRVRRPAVGKQPYVAGSEEVGAIEGIACPSHGAGVGDWSTDIERHHYGRHHHWATDMGFCHSTGLWTSGCGVMCPLRAAVVGSAVGLAPGQRVLDIGSACGHFARWFFEWFGAGTLGVDFLEEAVAFASSSRPSGAPMKFCWLDIAAGGLTWLPERHFDLATAISVLHYLRTDEDLWEWAPNATRTTCAALASTSHTQCRVAREMFRTVRVGGRVWISHNGSYKGKWDPRKVWGRGYWRCCFREELTSMEADLQEVSELELFLHSPDWDPSYSVIVRRLA